MQTSRTVVLFLKRCYQIGRIPLWTVPKQSRRQPFILNANMTEAIPERKAKSPEKLFTNEFRVQGEIANGKRTKYAINGEDFEVDDDTWVVGVLRCGAKARVRGITKPGVGKCATKITILALSELPVTTH